MTGECHAHVIMDGQNYRKAIDLHKNGVQDYVIRACFQTYQRQGVTFVRDGGDALGVSKRAKELAPEYGIDYRTPVFAIHKNGSYGSIVGYGFDNMKEYHQLVNRAGKEGADFIKIMTTGLMDFAQHGNITGTPLPAAEVKEMVHIAHEEGFAVMSHTNGVYGVQAAVEAGVDSIEHGNYMDRETLDLLAESNSVWVPTLVTVRNLLGCGRYEDSVIEEIMELAADNLRYAFRKKVKVAPGSDAGAYMVPHGIGIRDEYQAYIRILTEEQNQENGTGITIEAVRNWLEQGELLIRRKFCTPYASSMDKQ